MEIGNEVLGVIAPGPTLLRLRSRAIVNKAFVENARDGAPAEKRFRFAAKCIEGSCANWADGRCQVPKAAADFLGRTLDDGGSPDQIQLQPCSIRGKCRWFAQDGRPACKLCDLIVTDAGDAVAIL